jgi:2-polyprenyl-3-methyl-5-hydroxy-6-metoxy-1,4-benzoquinol methylase
MPTSRPFYLVNLANMVLALNPKSILDIGVGFGKNGMICREYADVWRQRYTPDKWNVQIDGIEVCEDYISAHHNHIYNTIHVGDALKILPTLEPYDFIVATDVIEHFEKPQAIEMMRLIAKKSKHFLITIPINVGRQANVHIAGVGVVKSEDHLSGNWTKEELEEFGIPLRLREHTWFIHNFGEMRTHPWVCLEGVK